MSLLIRKIDAVFVCDACGQEVYWYLNEVPPAHQYILDTLECVGCGARHSVELLTSRLGNYGLVPH